MPTLIDEIKTILTHEQVNTHADIQMLLQQRGFADVNQSTISRLLRRLGAIKVSQGDGNAIYQLPQESRPPATSAKLSHLVHDIAHNDSMIVIHTSPGSASLIARLLDHNRKKLGLLGTVAGDDTIIVIPTETQAVGQTIKKIQQIL